MDSFVSLKLGVCRLTRFDGQRMEGSCFNFEILKFEINKNIGSFPPPFFFGFKIPKFESVK